MKREISNLLEKDLRKPENRDIYAVRLDLDDLFYEEQCLFRDACDLIYKPIYQTYDNTGNYWYKVTADGELVHNNCCAEDFLIDFLKIKCDLAIWQLLQALVIECPYTFTFNDICIVIQKPERIFLDNSFKLHREGKPAVIYQDGYCIYAERGEEIIKD